MSKKKTNSNVVLYSILAILLVAVIICGVITQGFQVWTTCGCFGHNYGEDGKCTRCGEEKPADKPEPEQPAQPQASAFSAKQLAVAAVGPEYDTVDKRFNSLLRINGDSVSSVNVIILRNSTLNISALFPSYGDSSCDNFWVCYNKLGTNTWEGKKSTVNISAYGTYQVYVLKYPIYADDYTPVRSDVFTVYYGIESDLPAAPSKRGYTFTGWYTDEDCTQLYTEEYVTSDITLYAGFQPITYTLNFLAQGGTGTMQQMQCTYDVEYTLPMCGFTYPNYRFVGWAIDDDSDEATVGLTNGQKFSNLSEEDNYVIDLFAKWELETVTVSFDVDGTVTPTTVVIGQAAELPDDPSKTGYIFLGWYTSDGELYNGEAITEACTLTARFEIIRCTVTFMVDGQVYAVYVCDYGTSISEALKASEVNTVLYKAEDENF